MEVITCFALVVILLNSGSLFTVVADARQLPKKETYEYYVQIIRSNFSFSDPTAVRIAGKGGPDPSPPYAFGDTVVFDDKITEGPDFSSKELGRAKGTFFQPNHNSSDALKILVVSTLDFTTGKLIGTLPATFLEDTSIPVRSFAFHGGTGDFFEAHGLAVLTSTVVANGYFRSHVVLHISRQA